MSGGERSDQLKFGYALAFQTHVHKQVGPLRLGDSRVSTWSQRPVPSSRPHLVFFPPYICYPTRARACGDMFVIIHTMIITIGSSLTHSPRFAVITRTPSLSYDAHCVSSPFDNNITR
jgi:hypothetical protein